MQKLIRLFFVFILAVPFCLSSACNKENDPLTITPNPANPTVNTSVRFQSSQDGSGWKFTWSFGDGDFNTTNTSYADHTYIQPGVYNVTLNVEHNGNPLGSCSTSLTVQ
jgi:PKD repeat protein